MTKIKTLPEIFASNPKLLDEPEVKELITQFKFQFNNMKQKKMQYWQRVTDITMNSEFFVIGGMKFKDAIRTIHEESFDIYY